MASKSFPTENEPESAPESAPEPETIVQQSMVRQAQAATATPTDSTSSTKRKMPKDEPSTSHAAEDDVPPPAYGETYGELRGEKNGLGTSAYVTDDGRVNIRINQINRRLSQIFNPALRQQVESVQDTRPPPPPYIPTSLRSGEGVLPPPSLNVVIQVVGSRGDVQPFVALGKVLKDTYGHRVRLATHPIFRDFVQQNGLEFFSIGGDPSQLMAFMVKNPNLMPGFRSLLSGDVSQRRRDVAEYIQGCWRSCYKADDGMYVAASNEDISDSSKNDLSDHTAERPFVADCIIANPPSFAHIHCAERLGIPLHIMFTMPYSPTQAFPHPLANIQSSNADPQLTNYISYTMIELLSWQGLGDIINRFRAKCLGLDPVSLIWAPGMLQRLKIPHTYCWSPSLIPKPKDWGPNISVSGFYFLNLATNYTPTSDLQAFLNAGPAPVYIGFGSIVLDDPDTMTELILTVAKETGQRVLLSKGWGGMGADKFDVPESVFMLGNVPHDWLFKHVSCVVHHGGAGTTAAGVSAGRPTVVVPFFGDQPFWGAMIARAGAGPEPIPHKQLTADRLADAINFCLKPDSLERAKELASKIAAEQGSEMGAQSFHQYLEPDRLRCMLAPSRSATWRIKRTKIRLSVFAACTLANANLLDFNDLKLYRPREHNTDEGPWDPISGGAAACYRAFSGMVMGVAEFPTETLKPLRIPFKPSRQQSQESLQTLAKKSKSQDEDEGSSSLDAPARSQISLNTPESTNRGSKPTDPSSLSSVALNTSTSSTSTVPQSQLKTNQISVRSDRLLSGSRSDNSEDRDLLRRTGVHTSKGLGRTVKAMFRAPMEIQVGLTKGFHNFPRLWGDDTVRPQEQVNDLKSGITAAGKEFGFGLYDGFTGLATQPWKGAQKEGVVGFAKGFGKGIGGFGAKPLAGLAGILGHTLKGVYKEVENLFSSNVQTYIIASRVAQGYEDWMRSSEVEKQDVIEQWKFIQKYLKKDHSADEIMQKVLEVQRKKNEEGTGTLQDPGSVANPVQHAGAGNQTSELESAISTAERSLSYEESPTEADINEAMRLSVQETPHGDQGQIQQGESSNQGSLPQLQHQRGELADHETEQESLQQAIAASKAEAHQHATEASEFEEQLREAMVQSILEQ